jgi:hypothetical protein
MKTPLLLRKLSLILLVSYILMTGMSLHSQNRSKWISFELTTSGITSAGIYSSRDGHLIRTLWSNIYYPSGQHQCEWNLLNDDEVIVEDSNFVFKVLSNQLQYHWDGVIGNTSDSQTGPSKIRAFKRMHSVAIGDSFAYYSVGYNEAHPSCFKFDLKSPQNKINLLENYQGDIDQECLFVATDNRLVYWAGYDPYNPKLNFVYATDTKKDKEHSFPLGQTASTVYGRTYASAIDLSDNDVNARISGLAVQKTSKYLYVSHKTLNEIHVLNKQTGGLIQNYPIQTPGPLACNDETLWVIVSKDKILQFNIDTSGKLSSAIDSIQGFSEAMNLCLSKDETQLLVIDAGQSQQVKFFNTNTLNLIWTFGQMGGYANDPLVFDDKFYFGDTITNLNLAYVESDWDASFWVGDVGNERLMHFNSNGKYIEHIQYMPHSYSVVVDKNNPERVMNQYLEFKVDYSKALAPNNGSWKLYKNWRHCIKKDYYQDDALNLFKQLTEFSNGSSYAILDRFDNGIRKSELVELPPTGPMVYTGLSLGDFANIYITKEGHLRRLNFSRDLGDSGYWEQSNFLNSYSNRIPQWSVPNIEAQLPKVTQNDPAYLNYTTPVMSSGGYNIVFNAEKENAGYHLGAIKNGRQQWAWKTSKATFRSYKGPMPNDGRFDIGNGVEYPGGDVLTVDDLIFWNYHGEFWKNSQTNVWNVYHESGLMLGQFGITSLEGENASREAFAKGAGNVFSISIVKVKNDIYLYHNDESVHGGVHRWKISGTSDINIQEIPFKITKIKNGFRGQLFQKVDLDPIFLTQEFEIESLEEFQKNFANQNKYLSVRLSGHLSSNLLDSFQISIRNREGFRVFLNHKLILDAWNKSNNDTLLTPMIRKTQAVGQLLEIEVKKGTFDAKILSNQQLLGFDMTWVQAESIEDQDAIDLMLGMRPDRDLENQFYGWDGHVANASDFSCRMGEKSLLPNIDLSMKYLSDNQNYTIVKNLKGVSVCENWSISGKINFESNIPNFNENEFYIELLDTNSRQIAVFEHKMFNSQELNYPTQFSLNGEPIANTEYQKLYNLQNAPIPFELKFRETNILFSFGKLIPIHVKIKDLDADVNAPGKLQFVFKPSQSDVTLKSVSVSELKIKGHNNRSLIGNIRNSICPGDSLLLQANTQDNIEWNTGSKKMALTIKNPGKYWYQTESGACVNSSDTFELKQYEEPTINLKVKGDSLFANLNYKIEWFLNDTLIENLNSNSIKYPRKGIYYFKIKDSNQCLYTSKAVKINGSDIQEETLDLAYRIYPNPSQGIIVLHCKVEESAYSIIDESGKIVLNGNIKKDETLEIGPLKSGVYTLIAKNNYTIQYLNFVVITQ